VTRKLEASVALLLLSFAMSAQGAEPEAKRPADKPPVVAKPDIAFLEYLGTLEDDEENWTDIANTVLAEARSKRSAKQEATAKSAAEQK